MNRLNNQNLYNRLKDQNLNQTKAKREKCINLTSAAAIVAAPPQSLHQWRKPSYLIPIKHWKRSNKAWINRLNSKSINNIETKSTTVPRSNLRHLCVKINLLAKGSKRRLLICLLKRQQWSQINTNNNNNKMMMMVMTMVSLSLKILPSLQP